MQRILFIALGVLLGISVLAAPLTASAQNIDVDPLVWDYGDIVVGESATQIFTLTSEGPTPLTIHLIEITDDASVSFTIVSGETGSQILLPGEFIEIEVVFAPTGVGYLEAFMYISSNASSPDNELYVPLAGVGVTDATGIEEIMSDLLDEVDFAFGSGELQGVGSGNSASHRADAFMNMLYSTNDLIAAGEYETACEQFWQAYRRLDGAHRPPDFVEGPATDGIGLLIFDVMDALGCP